MPGYATEVMGADELAEAIDAAKVFLDFMSIHSAEDINIYRHNGDLVSTWRESPDGKWTLGEDEFSPLFPVAVNLSQPLLDKVAALPVNEKLNLEIGAIAVPTGKSKSGRGHMGRFMVAVPQFMDEEAKLPGFMTRKFLKGQSVWDYPGRRWESHRDRSLRESEHPGSRG